MPGGQPLLTEWGGFLGKGGAGLLIRPPTAQWSATPQLWGGEGARGEGAEPGLESRGLS